MKKPIKKWKIFFNFFVFAFESKREISKRKQEKIKAYASMI
jgi:hypothetical protein